MKKRILGRRVSIFFSALVLIVSSATAENQDAQREVMTLNEQASKLTELGDYAKALPLQKRELEIMEKAYGPEHPYTAALIAIVGNTYYNMGNYSKALSLMERALSISEKTLGPDNPNVGALLRVMAHTHKAMGNYEKAFSLAGRSLAIDEKSFGPEHEKTFNSLLLIGILKLDLGNYKEGRDIIEKCMVFYEKTNGPDDANLAGVLNVLSDAYRGSGDYTKSLKLQERSLSIMEKELGPNHPNTAVALDNLGEIYGILGNNGKSLELKKQALDVFEKALGPEDLKTAFSMRCLAETYQAMGNNEKASTLYEKSLAIQEKELGPNHPETGGTLSHLGSINRQVGNYNKALTLQQRAFEICVETKGSEHPDTALILNSLARTYQAIKEYDKALPLFERSLAIDEKALGSDHPDTGANLKSIALNYYLSGNNLPKTREFLDKAFSLCEKQIENILNLDENTRLSWQRDNLKYNMIDLLPLEQISHFLLKTKGIVLDSLLEDQADLNKLGVQSPERKEIASYRLRIGKLAFSSKNEDHEEILRLKAQIDFILSNAAGQRAKVGRVRKSLTLSPNIVAAGLTEGEMLLEFIQFHDPKTKGDAGRSYGVLLLARDGETKYLRIDDATRIDSAIQASRDAMSRGDEKKMVENQNILFEKLWEPLSKNLPNGVKKIYIGADGQLNFLSFATLPLPDGSFLAEHFDIAYVGSGRDLGRKVTPSDSKTIALFADPVFDRKASVFSTNALALRSGQVDALGQIVLPPLPGTRAEEAAVEQVAKAGGWTPEARLGVAANKSAIVGLKKPCILHLATHGFYLNTFSSNGAEGERGMEIIGSLDRGKPAPLPKIDPMHASGIALTGAQATLKAWSEGRVPDPKEDGILTAEEVAGLDLDGTWLVTLSACDTGSGEARSGEGVFGLRRAFMMAGAQNLLMTLWPVSDEVTPKIMADFYKEALATHDAAGSLAKVQRDWLVKLRKEKGLLAAVRDAGPFAMVVMANPNAKPMPESSAKVSTTSCPEAAPSTVSSSESISADSTVSPNTSKGGNVIEFNDALTKAEAGDAYAQAVVSIYYGLGYKTDKDTSKAAEYASKSSAQNNPLGQYQLGVLTAGGEGLEKDQEKGKSLKVQSTEGLNTMSEDPYALAALGSMSIRGEGVSKNMKKAAKLYKRSADLGYAPAQVLYSAMLANGAGVILDAKKAKIYHQKALEQNYNP